MKLTLEWLEGKNACREGVKWFIQQKETDPIKIINGFIETKEHLDWANWLIVRCMEYKQYVAYAIFAAEQVIDIYEKKYPSNKKPREAIEAAKKCLEAPSDKNKAAAAYAAAASAAYAAYAAYAASAASAAYKKPREAIEAAKKCLEAPSDKNKAAAASAADAAAYAAASAADAAAYAAYAASAASAAYAADAAAAYARTEMRIRTLKYGLELMTDSGLSSQEDIKGKDKAHEHTSQCQKEV